MKKIKIGILVSGNMSCTGCLFFPCESLPNKKFDCMRLIPKRFNNNVPNYEIVAIEIKPKEEK